MMLLMLLISLLLHHKQLFAEGGVVVGDHKHEEVHGGYAPTHKHDDVRIVAESVLPVISAVPAVPTVPAVPVVPVVPAVPVLPVEDILVKEFTVKPRPAELVIVRPSLTAQLSYIPPAIKEFREQFRHLSLQYPGVPLLDIKEVAAVVTPMLPPKRMGKAADTNPPANQPDYMAVLRRMFGSGASTPAAAAAVKDMSPSVKNLEKQSLIQALEERIRGKPLEKIAPPVFTSGEEPCGNNFGVCASDRDGGVVIDSMTPCSSVDQQCRRFVYENQSISRQSIVYFQSPRFPLSRKEGMSSSLTVTVRDGVDQVLIEMETFSIPAGTAGVCDRDYVEIISSGKPAGVFGPGNSRLCGQNTDQHLYLPVRAGDLLMFRAVISALVSPFNNTNSSAKPGSNDSEYRFSIKISQIPSKVVDEDGAMAYYKRIRAPADCLQYFTADSGLIQPFNYDGKNELTLNLDYAVCIRQPENGCEVYYRAQRFEMLDSISGCDGTVPAVNGVLCCTGGGKNAVKYIGLEGSSDGSALKGKLFAANQKRYFFCGSKFGRTGVVISQKRAPAIIEVFSDGLNTSSDGVGFSLFYRTKRC